MPILQSFCCCNSLRRGSYFCAIFSMLFFTSLSILFYRLIREERDHMAGRNPNPKLKTFLYISEGSLIYSMMFMVSSMLIAMSAFVLTFGIYFRKTTMFLPWIAFLCCNNIMEIGHIIYLLFKSSTEFTPVIGFIFTLDFFIIAIDSYCLLCVLSHYQELLDAPVRGLPPSREIVPLRNLLPEEATLMGPLGSPANPSVPPSPHIRASTLIRSAPHLRASPRLDEIERREDVFAEITIDETSRSKYGRTHGRRSYPLDIPRTSLPAPFHLEVAEMSE